MRENEVVKWGEALDVRVEEEGCDEDEDGVEVHGELVGVDGCAGEDGEHAEGTGDFVDELEEGDYFGAGAEGHRMEECLQGTNQYHCGAYIVSGEEVGMVKERVLVRTRGRGISKRPAAMVV